MTYKVKEALRLRNEMTEHLRLKKSKEEYRELDYRWEHVISTMTVDEQKLYAQEVGR
jgi:hypothetical protein